jgi:ribosome-binding factor A
MPKSNARTQRIESQLQRALAELLRRGVKDPRVGAVTITSVRVAPDLSVARVDFLPFAGTRPAGEVLAGLESAAGYLRGELARELSLRHAPRLQFRVDVDLERAHRLSELIDSAVQGDRARGEPENEGGDAPGPSGSRDDQGSEQ